MRWWCDRWGVISTRRCGEWVWLVWRSGECDVAPVWSRLAQQRQLVVAAANALLVCSAALQPSSSST